MQCLSQRQLGARPAACASTAGSTVAMFAPRPLPCRRMQAATVAAAGKGFGAPPKPKVEKPKAEPGPPPTPCPCTSGRAYKNCCQTSHTGVHTPLTPEAALRARFSAFVKGEEQFIVESTHPDFLAFHYEGRSAEEAKEAYSQDIKTACTKFDYEELNVGKSEAGADPQTEGFVAFTYRSAPKLQPGQTDEQRDWKTTNEKARFLRVDKKWLFTDYQRFEYNMNSLMQQPPEPLKQ